MYVVSDLIMKTLEMTLVFFGLIMALYSQPALCSDAETEPEGENGANSMVMFLTSVPALILSALMAKLMH